MESIQRTTHIDDNGILHLHIPELRDRDVEVTIVDRPIARSSKKQWSPEFFDRTFGCWQGEPLVREFQGESQEREPLLGVIC